MPERVLLTRRQLTPRRREDAFSRQGSRQLGGLKTMACTGPGAIPSFLVARPGRKQSSAGAITDACLWAKASAGRALSPVAPPPTDLSITAHSTGCRSPPKRGPPRWPCPVLLRRSRTGAVPRDWLRGLSSGPSPPAGLRCSASPRERVRLRLPPRVSPPFRSGRLGRLESALRGSRLQRKQHSVDWRVGRLLVVRGGSALAVCRGSRFR